MWFRLRSARRVPLWYELFSLNFQILELQWLHHWIVHPCGLSLSILTLSKMVQVLLWCFRSHRPTSPVWVWSPSRIATSWLRLGGLNEVVMWFRAIVMGFVMVHCDLNHAFIDNSSTTHSSMSMISLATHCLPEQLAESRLLFGKVARILLFNCLVASQVRRWRRP